MWRRLMRKTFARRPPLFMEQWAPALVTAVLVAGGIAIVVWLLR
jgi:hypothetical protein